MAIANLSTKFYSFDKVRDKINELTDKVIFKFKPEIILFYRLLKKIRVLLKNKLY